MKTINTVLIAATLLCYTAKSNAQTAVNDEEITAETFIRMLDNDLPPAKMSPLRIENSRNGFAVKWQTFNENNVTGFEVQIGEDRNNFTTIKKIAPIVASQPAKVYAAEFNNTLILSEKAYFRVKTSFTNGTVCYTDIAAVKFKTAK